MCGFIGVVGTSSLVSEDFIRSALDDINYRGPDARGVLVDKSAGVALGHVRLAIQDLSEYANQPFTIDGVTIVFNGEIYNFLDLKAELEAFSYRFKTSSDTEVLLVSYLHWGIKCLDKIEGMYAFAIYDSNRNKIFLVRDRVGEKPLFYKHIEGEGLVFGSELKSIFDGKKQDLYIDNESLDYLLATGATPRNASLVCGYCKLEPGKYIEYDLTSCQIKIVCYWHLQSEPKKLQINRDKNISYYSDKVGDLLQKSVAQQMISDVPVGILLSGGLDSSLIAHYASKVNPDINTFTVTFPGHKAQDESEYARLISKHVGSNHTEIPLKEINADILVKMANTLDEPIIDSSLIPSFQVFEEVSKHCKVVLGGDGADEIFGGYRHHNRSYLLQLLTRPLGCRFKKILQENVSKHDYFFNKGRNYLSNIDADFKSSLPIIPLYFSQSMRVKLTGRHLLAQHQAEYIWKCNVPAVTDYRLRQLHMDFQNFLVSDILVKVDRTSMMHSVEVRAPFLNRDLLDYAFGAIPTKFKYNTKSRKMVLQQLGQDNLPSSFNTKRKQGFSLPLADWIRSGPFRDLFNDVLRSESSPFCNRTVSQLFTEHQSGIDHSEQLFALVMINLWVDRYNINF